MCPSNRMPLRGALRLAFLVALSVPLKPLRADTTLDSGTTTVSTETDFGDLLMVASTGTATMNVVDGGYATNSIGYIGYGAGSDGTVNVSSGTWATSDFLGIGWGYPGASAGTLTVSGGSVTAGATVLGGNVQGVGTVTIAGGSFSTADFFSIGLSGIGTLRVTDGSVVSGTSVLGAETNSVGTAIISGGTWATSGDLTVGMNGTATLKMTGGLVSVAGALSKGARGTINLDPGGTLQIGTGGDTGVLLGGTGSIINDGTLIFNRADATTHSGMINGSGAVEKQGGGALTLSANNSYTGGTTIIAGAVTIPAGGSISHGSAALVIGQASGESATLNVTGGIVTNGAGIIGNNFFSIGTVAVSSGTWATSYDLAIGYGVSSTGSLTVSGGSVTNAGQGIIGNHGSNGTVTVSSGTWANGGDLTVGVDNGTGTLTMTGGLVSVAGALSKGANGTINLDPGGTLQIGTGDATGVLLGGTGSIINNGTLIFNPSDASTHSGLISGTGAILKQGPGTLTLSNPDLSSDAVVMDRALTVLAGTLEILASGTGTLSVGDSGIGTLSVSGGSVSAATCYLGSQANSAGTATVSSGTWANSGNVVVGLSGTATLTMTGGLVTVGGTLSTGPYGTINLNPGGRLQIGVGGTTGKLDLSTFVNNGTLAYNRSDSIAINAASAISGTGTIENAGTGTLTLTGQTAFTDGLGATAGRLIVGSTASLNGFSTTGSLSVASGATVELKSRGLAYVNGLSTLTGGTILAANGISLGAGANVFGAGVISGRIAAVAGSRVEASGGRLALGDAASYSGIYSDGELYTNADEVELFDRNLAVLGSLTQLGNGSAGGSLRAANGMLLEGGKNLVGRGTVYGNFVNQGDVYGDGSTAGQTIVFAAGSTVSGIGSFENVVFNGTYSPGNSPAITSLTDGQFSSSSTLRIELGGTQPGTQYDRVVDSGLLTLLGGTLDVVLYNSFVPSIGDSFEILQYGQLSSDFGTVNVPALSGDLSWQRTTSATAMTLTVVPEPSAGVMALVGLACGGATMFRRRTRR